MNVLLQWDFEQIFFCLLLILLTLVVCNYPESVAFESPEDTRTNDFQLGRMILILIGMMSSRKLGTG